METRKDALNWFEISVSDFDRAKSFYQTIFGYELQETNMGEYRMGFFPQENGGVGGAIVQGENCIPANTGTLVYLNPGDDLQPVLDKVENAGGSVAMPKTQITPEIGYIAMFLDTEGNKVGLHSPR